MKIKLFLALAIAFVLSACGKSEQEMRAEAVQAQAAAQAEAAATQPQQPVAQPADQGAPVVEYKAFEEGRLQAKTNATKNAAAFIANDPVTFEGYKPVPNGDSSQTPNCAQGDGWATIKLVKPNAAAISLKCSTVSAGVGCLTQEDFEKKDVYKSQEGHCQPTTVVPFPIPKF